METNMGPFIIAIIHTFYIIWLVVVVFPENDFPTVPEEPESHVVRQF